MILIVIGALVITIISFKIGYIVGENDGHFNTIKEIRKITK